MTSSKQSELEPAGQYGHSGHSAAVLAREVERLTRENIELVKLRQDNIRYLLKRLRVVDF